MKTAFVGSIALVLTLAAPIAAHPAAKTHPSNPVHRTMTYDPDLARATALAPQGTNLQLPAFVRETDGLGRDDDDCVYGCIDH